MQPSAFLTASNRGKLIGGGSIFLLLTLLVFWYQFHQIQAGDAVPQFGRLRWGYLILILCFLPIETLALGLRMWVVCRVLQPGIGFWTCFQADLASSGVALLTPAQTGGGPGQIYMLNRGGARLGTALTISLLAFVGTIVALLGFGLYSLFFSGIGHASPLFLAAVGILMAMSALMISLAMWPGFFRAGIGLTSRSVWKMRGGKFSLHDWWPPDHSRACSPVDRMDSFSGKLADLAYIYRTDLRRYLRKGKSSFVIVCLLSLLFLLARSFLAYFCVRFLGIEASSIGEIFKIQIALLFLTYLAPTPGNAGIAEGASSWIMQDIVPLGFAPYYNILWRFSTVYIAATAGLILLGHRIVLDLRKNIHRRHPC